MSLSLIAALAWGFDVALVQNPVKQATPPTVYDSAAVTDYLLQEIPAGATVMPSKEDPQELVVMLDPDNSPEADLAVAAAMDRALRGKKLKDRVSLRKEVAGLLVDAQPLINTPYDYETNWKVASSLAATFQNRFRVLHVDGNDLYLRNETKFPSTKECGQGVRDNIAATSSTGKRVHSHYRHCGRVGVFIHTDNSQSQEQLADFLSHNFDVGWGAAVELKNNGDVVVHTSKPLDLQLKEAMKQAWPVGTLEIKDGK